MKSRMIEQLGQTDILLPSLITEALAANDRVKVRLSALQAAAEHARIPTEAPGDLTAECRAAGVDPTTVRSLVTGAHKVLNGRIAAPALARMSDGIVEDVGTMIRAVEAGAPTEGEAAAGRLSVIKAQGLFATTDEIQVDQIAKLVGLGESGGDSLHRLVMDLHKVLNRLAAAGAEDVVAGAHVFGLLPGDQAVIEAFMRGLDRTRALKFDHPGLDTMAMRSGSRLIIQNDIGTTDAHIVVITVEQSAVSVTYTDVHLARAKFFIDLFDKFPMRWSGLDRNKANGLGDDGVFFLVTGQCGTNDSKDRDSFLEALGASLVFLIDWNKARKVLRSSVSKGDAVRVLDWAARNRVGHRAFLELGGGELVASAVRNAAPSRIGFGEQLDAALGREAAVDLLKTVLRISAEALLEGRSIRLVRDRIEAEVVRHLERVDSTLLGVVLRQAGLAREIAARIAHHIAGRRSGRLVDGNALTDRARRIEEKADKIAIEARREIARLDASPTIARMIDQVEETVDDLEQAAFIASLMPAEVDTAALDALAELSAAALDGTEAAACAIVAAADVPEGRRVDSEDALTAVARLIDLEHEADARERAVTTLVLRGNFDPRASLAVLELARATERATDRLAGFGHLLRHYVLTDLSA
jgi:uncharacterized protein Yka (UPF0111/DUF47 family)